MRPSQPNFAGGLLGAGPKPKGSFDLSHQTSHSVRIQHEQEKKVERSRHEARTGRLETRLGAFDVVTSADGALPRRGPTCRFSHSSLSLFLIRKFFFFLALPGCHRVAPARRVARGSHGRDVKQCPSWCVEVGGAKIFWWYRRASNWPRAGRRSSSSTSFRRRSPWSWRARNRPSREPMLCCVNGQQTDQRVDRPQTSEGLG
ncbi:hypothetical protein B0T18DRAFT_219058 [Schizothecium vesticola]|uniref:Uncharacterized protein n=1 Tax=Schizothecium vesticola TaxID=314040 RepID=A0AA40EK98_9PEZI|nr:hypothetical protein B0T18DRAFT_219058 [Schizothecium vesticola]